MRADLLALTPQSLATLANVGIVKRAGKEVEAGAGPLIQEEKDGTVVALYRDGATARLAIDTPLGQTQCSCGASTVCRHRVAAVLAYQRAYPHANATCAELQAWDPGTIDDEALRLRCGSLSLERARALTHGSFVVTTRPQSQPIASLPNATVQFLVPQDLAYAKCDCAQGIACEHVVLAVWAFRRCPEGGLVELGSSQDAATTAALATVEATLHLVASRGIVASGISHELGAARAIAECAGMVWIADALADLEMQKEAYDQQSALFKSRTCSLLVAEVGARLRASRQAQSLPCSWVLGSGELRETTMGQARLVSLGARLTADKHRRMAEVYFAEIHSRSVLVLRKEWHFDAGKKPKNGHELGQMFASSRLSLTTLAKGELLARSAKRLANGGIDFAAARGMKTSALPPSGQWGNLPEPILVADLAAHEQATQAQAPRLLRPRRMGDGIHVVPIGAVIDVAYCSADQELVGIVEDAAGTRLLLRTPHRTVSSGAVDASREALAGTPRFVSGHLRRASQGWEMEPLAIVGERVIVPDLEPPKQAQDLPAFTSRQRGSEFQSLLCEFHEWVDRAIHHGCAAVTASSEPLAQRLEDAGMDRIGEQVRRAGGGSLDALLDAAIVQALIHETA